MIHTIYAEIAEIFWKNSNGYTVSVFDYILTVYLFRDKVPLDKFFGKITNNLEYKKQKYNFDLNNENYPRNFNYRASSWIFTIAISNWTESEKAEMIKLAAEEIISDVFAKNKVLNLLWQFSKKSPLSDTKINPWVDYFSKEKIQTLKDLKNNNFDISKLIQILEEVNLIYKNSCYLSVSSLLRMLIDHIPPIFGYKSFKEVVNNYKFSLSDGKNLEHLLGGLKNISDWTLHSHIGNKEVLPTEQTIEFRADFDVLLKNIIFILNKN